MTPSEIDQKTVDSIFQVVIPEGGGTAFLVRRDGLVITNYHVVEGHARVHLQGLRGGPIGADVVLAHHAEDLAAIRLAFSPRD